MTKQIKVTFALRANVRDNAEILRDVNTPAETVMCSALVPDTGYGYGIDNHPYTTAWEWRNGHLHCLSQGHRPDGQVIVAVDSLPTNPKTEAHRVIEELEARRIAYCNRYASGDAGETARQFIAALKG